MSERKGFRFAKDGNVYWFFTLDRPIRRPQTDRFDQEFDAVIDKIMLRPRTKQARLTRKWRDHLTSITNDGYGSFRLDFESEMEDYTDAELAAFNDDIFEIVCNLPIVETMQYWIGIEEDTEDFVECHGAEDAMEMYIDAVLESGYRLHQSDVEDIFNWDNEDPKMAQIIANDFLLRKLKGQDVVCKELQTTPEQAVA